MLTADPGKRVQFSELDGRAMQIYQNQDIDIRSSAPDPAASVIASNCDGLGASRLITITASDTVNLASKASNLVTEPYDAN